MQGGEVVTVVPAVSLAPALEVSRSTRVSFERWSLRVFFMALDSRSWGGTSIRRKHRLERPPCRYITPRDAKLADLETRIRETSLDLEELV
jgi:hypothetical protein